MSPPFTGHFRITLDTPRGLQSLHPGTRPPIPTARLPGTPVPPSSGKALSGSLQLRSSIYQTTSKASRALSASDATALAGGSSPILKTHTHTCDTCGADCSLVRYHCLKDEKLEICAPCYLDGRFSSNLFSGDFVKLTATPPGIPGASSANNDWSDQEVLLLLEGVEMYDDDWSKIEEHVGTRSSQQCIRKFLELPIEDSYLRTEGSMGPLRFGRIPFDQADNPVLSVVAFLAGVVSRGVASESISRGLDDGEGGKGADNTGIQSRQGHKQRKDEDKMEHTPASQQKVDSSDPNNFVPKPAAAATHAIPHSQAQRAAYLALSASAKAASSLASAEHAQIHNTLATLVKLTLTKLEVKMTQFEELEDVLEEKRKNLESAKVALVNERLGLKKMLDTIRGEIGKHQQITLGGTNIGQSMSPLGFSQAIMNAATHQNAPLGTMGQGIVVNEVQRGQGMEEMLMQNGQIMQLS